MIDLVQFGLREELSSNLNELNYNHLTPIQEKSLPISLSGKDIIAQAKTGSGKTAAFGLAILNGLDTQSNYIQSLVICPTRELADQVARELRRLARMMNNVKVLTITGGVPEFRQEKSLEHGAHIVVGTPGRIRKLLKKRSLKLNATKKLVLDEADTMLDMGFIEDIEWINQKIENKDQTLLFSATFPDEILSLSHSIQQNAEMVKIDATHSTNIIKQVFVKLDSHKDKEEALLKVLDYHRPSRFIVFCKTKIISDKVAQWLYDNGVEALSIHGDIEQKERTRTLTLFSNRSLSAIVATDVAARGLDIKDLEMVINFDLATNPEVYTHRIGRTARAGKTGLAVSLFIEKEMYKYDEICEFQGANDIIIEDVSSYQSSKEYDLKPQMESIFISGGRKDKLRPGDIVGTIVQNTDAEFEDIGEVTILNTTTYVAINKSVFSKVLFQLSNVKIKKRKFKIGRVRI